jgi:hypothetical protein
VAVGNGVFVFDGTSDGNGVFVFDGTSDGDGVFVIDGTSDGNGVFVIDAVGVGVGFGSELPQISVLTQQTQRIKITRTMIITNLPFLPVFQKLA